MLRNSDEGCLRLALKYFSGQGLLFLIKTKLNKILAQLSCHSAFSFPDFFLQIHSHAMKLCLLYLSSRKWRSDLEQCVTRKNFRIFAFFI